MIRYALAAGCSVLALVPAAAGLAQDIVLPGTGESAPSPQEEAREDPSIVVIGQRVIVAALVDVEPEQVYDEDRVAGYDVSTVGELLGEVRRENGDQDPAFLVNGQPVRDIDDISDLPVEAIERIESLPRGAAQRIGGAAGQRAYNVVLRKSVKSATLTGSYEAATEGGWDNRRGEALLTYIRGQDRVNLMLRAAETDVLFESERDEFIPRVLPTPFSAAGNIVPASGAEIDPALSMLAGQPVTVLGLPMGLGNPTLATLLAGANRPNAADDARFRSLRSGTRPYEIGISGNKTLLPWLALSFNGRLGWNEFESFRGLPSARFLVSANNAFTPFTVPVGLALNDPSRPLRSANKSTSGSASATLNANFELWHVSLAGRFDRRKNTFVSEFASSGTIAVDPATNPFGGTLAALIPVGSRTSESETTTWQANLDAEGPLFNLWAGPVRARLGAGAAWTGLESTLFTGTANRLDRHEYTARAGLTVPLTGRDPAFLSSLGESDLAVDFARVNLGRYGKLDRYSLAANWQPVDWLRLTASKTVNERAIALELFGAPAVITPNVPYFDPVTAQTVDVATIYGGAGALTNDEQRSRSLSATLTPLQRYELQLSARYEVSELRNQIGALPPSSTAVVAAFPDRFVRDGNGVLVLVDNRSVNFERQRDEQLRLGLGFVLPIAEAVTIPANNETGAKSRRVPATRLQVNASHSILLDSTTLIRSGLPIIDLKAGGAIGIAGGGQHSSSDLTVSLTRGSTGARLTTRRTGTSLLVIGGATSPDLLTFEPVTTTDLKLFADLGQFFRESKAARQTRVTLAFDNLFNARQRVRNTAGATPQAFQPIYRDAIGRTVSFELRKVF